MPKILVNIRRRLLDEAKAQLQKNGYGGTTMRSVAAACDVSVGTLYNYFTTKDMLIAQFMLDDWQEALERMKVSASQTSDASEILKCIHKELMNYSQQHRTLFDDPSAAKAFHAVLNDKHQLLVAQIADIIKPYCEAAEYEDADYASKFIAEIVLSHGVAREDYAKLSPILNRLL